MCVQIQNKFKICYLRDAANDEPLNNTREDSLYAFNHSVTLENALRQHVAQWHIHSTLSVHTWSPGSASRSCEHYEEHVVYQSVVNRNICHLNKYCFIRISDAFTTSTCVTIWPLKTSRYSPGVRYLTAAVLYTLNNLQSWTLSHTRWTT